MNDPFWTLSNWGMGLFMLGIGIFFGVASFLGAFWLIVLTLGAL